MGREIYYYCESSFEMCFRSVYRHLADMKEVRGLTRRLMNENRYMDLSHSKEVMEEVTNVVPQYFVGFPSFSVSCCW